MINSPALSLLLVSAGCSVSQTRLDHPTLEHSRLIDLTYAFGSDTIVWPLDKIPLGNLVGAGVRIDVSEPCARDRDYRITIQDFERWEATHGRIPDRAIMLLDTGFARYWPSRQDYLGTERRGPEGVQALHFPGVHPDAAAWLAGERRIKAVGIDTPSIDYGQSTHFEAHITLPSQNVPVFENLAGLRTLPDLGFEVVGLPMKVAGGSGGPLRIIAVLPPLH